MELRLEDFFAVARKAKLSGKDQLIFLYLCSLIKSWDEVATASDAQLLNVLHFHEPTGKPSSTATVRKCRSRLKLKGFISYSVDNRGVTYKLTPLDAVIAKDAVAPFKREETVT